MTNQEIYDMLAQDEERLLLAYWSNPTPELKAAHAGAWEALIAFYKLHFYEKS